jgi:hypothetical protein
VWSFLIATGIAVLGAVFLLFRMRAYNHRMPPEQPVSGDGSTPGDQAPKAEADGPGPIEPGTYMYAVTSVTTAQRHVVSFLSRKCEGKPSAPSDKVCLEDYGQVKLTELKAGPAGTVKRRIYRKEKNEGKFRRVGEVAGNEDKASYTDTWTPIGLRTPLRALGTDWSFKDNWISSVTVGSTLLLALLASSSVLEAALGSDSKTALSQMAVAAAIAAVFVGISPLIVKVIGDDLSVPTVGGTLAAAVVTTAAALGQIIVVTWQSAELASASDEGAWRAGILVVGVVVAVIVLWYAARALWYYMRTGAQFTAEKASEQAKAANAIAAAIKDAAAHAASVRAEAALDSAKARDDAKVQADAAADELEDALKALAETPEPVAEGNALM